MKRMGIVIAAVMLLITLPLSSQQAEGDYEFEQALQEMLKAEGWSSEEIQKLLKEEVDWEQARIRDAEMIAICLVYAKDAEEEIGPYEQAQMAMEVMTMAREMRALGFAESQILRTSLNGIREVFGDLEKLREQKRLRTGEDNGIGADPGAGGEKQQTRGSSGASRSPGPRWIGPLNLSRAPNHMRRGDC